MNCELWIDNDAFALHQLKELFPDEEKDELIVFAAFHMNADRRKERCLVTVDVGNIRILHFEVPVFRRDRQFAGPVGDGVFIRDDFTAQQTAVAEADHKQLFLHTIFLRMRRQPLFDYP